MMRIFIVFLSAYFFTLRVAYASIEVEPVFATTAQSEQYRVLITILRCPTCQNQNIAESNAPLARQLREQLIEHIRQGRSNREIISYFTERYGDYISYDPAFNRRTFALWLVPIFAMLASLLWWLKRPKRQQLSLSEEEKAELANLIKQHESPKL